MASDGNEERDTQGTKGDGSRGAQEDHAPARQGGDGQDGHAPARKDERQRPAENVPSGQTVPEQAYSDYVLHYDEDDATSGKIPDVLLDVPVLEVDGLELDVDGLRAQVNVSAEVLQLANVNVGVDAKLGKLKLGIERVQAQLLLKARLDNLTAIVDRVMTTIDRNPQIVEKAVEGVGSAAQSAGEGAGAAAKEAGSGAGQAAQQAGEGAGQAARQAGEGAGQAAGEAGQGAAGAAQQAGEQAGQAAQDAEGATDQAGGRAGQAPGGSEQTTDGNADGGGSQTTERTVDDRGNIFETVLDESGEVVDEREGGNVADLPVEEERIDEEGRVVSLARDDSGNAYEMVLDDRGNPTEFRAA